MRRFILGLALLVSVALTASAKADTVFNLTNGTFQSGATISGTININTATGEYDSANLTYSLGGVSAVFDGPFANWGETFNMSQFFGTIYDSDGDLYVIDLPVTWIINYTGGPICSNATLCDDYFGYFQSVNGDIDPSASGLLVPAAVTPEPSSLFLVGSGLCSVLGLGRKNYIRRKQA